MLKIYPITRKTNSWGIITGDLVHFRSLSTGERKRVLDFFLLSLNTMLVDYFPECEFLTPKIYRGDSWQMGVFPCKFALRIGILIRAKLKFQFNNLDTRIAIGIGKVDTAPKESVNIGFGEAYTLSGELLDNMNDRRMIIRSIEDPKGITHTGQALDIIISFIDKEVTNWTPRQAQAALGALRGQRQVDIALQWKPRAINQQAVSMHLNVCNWKLIQKSIKFIESELLS